MTNLITLTKVGYFPTMGFETEKGLFTTWDDARKAANKLISENDTILVCILDDCLTNQLERIERPKQNA